MRRAAVLVVVLAGCFAPHPPVGIECASPSAAVRCPGDQVCVTVGGTDVCMDPGAVVDAALDAPSPSSDAPQRDAAPDAYNDDLDGDGIPNELDNCPTIANPDQGNEDGDKFGDVCDSCPIVANDAPVDTDGDGVDDDCDPYPTTPGDKIALFEGFHHGVPTGWETTGTWTGSGDSVIGTSTTNAVVVPPHTPTDEEQITIATTATTLKDNTVFGTSDPTNATGTAGMLCGLKPSPLLGLAGSLELANLAGGIANATDFTPVANTTYQLVMARNGTGYACTVTGATPTSVTTTSSLTVASPLLAVGIDNGTVRIDYVMVITQTGDEAE